MKTTAIVLGSTIFLVVGLLTKGCAPEPVAYLTSPQQQIYYNTNTDTRYVLTEYREDTKLLTVLRDQEGNSIVSLLYQDPGVFVVFPGEEPVQIRPHLSTLVKDEMKDVWSGEQEAFSFVPLLYNQQR